MALPPGYVPSPGPPGQPGGPTPRPGTVTTPWPMPAPTPGQPQWQNAYEVLLATLRNYGLEGLAGELLKMFQDGLSEAEINLRIQETDAYKKRFAANEQRRAKGLPVLSPAEYLAVEASFREIMSVAGLPPGFYDEPSDFEAWIANDVSPVEIQQRVRTASSMVNSLDAGALDSFREFYTQGDLIAYALDRDRATAVLDRQWQAAQVSSAARLQGFGGDQELSERLADMGVDSSRASQGFSAARHLTDGYGRLSQVYGGEYDAEDAVGEVFLSDQGASQRRRRLASQERAAFSGSSGTAAGSLNRRQGGQI